MAGCWVSICFLTGTCGQYEVMRMPGTFKSPMNGRQLSLISLDVNFIDDTFYLSFLPDLQGVRVVPSLVSDCQHTWNVDGYTRLVIENWLQSERWLDLCLVP
ncbi:hypothetical protein AMTRI_Chr07g27590 [Amborella trichopoda]